jgi:hypothetical protein
MSGVQLLFNTRQSIDSQTFANASALPHLDGLHPVLVFRHADVILWGPGETEHPGSLFERAVNADADGEEGGYSTL